MAEGIPIKSVWGKKPVTAEEEPPIVSFAEIMSEELAEELQDLDVEDDERDRSEIEAVLQHGGVAAAASEDSGVLDCSRDFELALQLAADPDCSADVELALQLQREFDREAELAEQFERSRKDTGVATAKLAADPYHYLQEEESGESSGEEEDDDDMREFATTLLYESKKEQFPPCGFVRNNDGEIITKHDKDMTQRRNCNKMMQFPIEFPTGDVVGSKVSNKIFNDLRMYSKQEVKRVMRLKDKNEKATGEASVDALTRLILFKWINAELFDAIEGVIATGKESAVLHAVGGLSVEGKSDEEETDAEEADRPATSSVSSHYAIKVYKMSLSTFRNRSEYVKDDFRFKNPRRVLRIWAEKEFMNLQRLKRAQVKCPTPLKLKKHVLLMSLIGNGTAAPTLKEVKWAEVTTEQKHTVFSQVRDIMVRMFVECKLVHGDLSEYNLLYNDETVYVIDVAQAVDVSHSRALVFLVRDIENVLDFFGRIGVEALPKSADLFAEITGVQVNAEKDLMSQVEAFERENRNANVRKDKHNPADYELRLFLNEHKSGAGPSTSS
ncbi:atypical/RIO/RIO3 protein kinase [Aphelenchoides avenae]|nr:atypical/RIO/RIO3 protein kinase [Aphelenchus avenae]